MSKCFKTYCIAIVCSIGLVPLQAQEYAVNTIPDSLKNNMNVVVREYTELFIQNDVNNATYKVNKVVTVLNKNGDSSADFYGSYDKFREMTGFSGIVRNAAGNIIKKIKKSDLTTSSLSEDSFATDGYIMYYDCQSPTYPYTIEYTYQEKWKNGIVAYPAFRPMEGYWTSVENATYQIEVPQNIALRHYTNYDTSLKKSTANGKILYEGSMRNMRGISYEPYAPSYRKIFPTILLAPSDFCYDSHCGNMQSWKNYGLWVYGLLEDRDRLTPDFAMKLQNLVRGAKSTREKVAILYDYLQKNSRYVSIQLGIGGFQPIEAATVAKNRLGDCKGLTNLMKAMLTAVNIPSNYCEIGTRERVLYSDYPNFHQTNHAILLVPQKNDSIWLECTNQTIPFSYIPSVLAGHDAVVMTESGGKLCRLPSYSSSQNRKESILKIVVDENGGAAGNLSFVENLDGYENVYTDFRSKDRERIARYVTGNVRLPQIQIKEINTSENRSSLPSARIDATFESTSFANKTGARLFIPICPLVKKRFDVFTSPNRLLEIHIDNGFSETDTIVLDIPESFALESLPKNIVLETSFGSLNARINQDGNRITYIQTVDVKSGVYDKSQYKELKDFFAQITSATKRTLVLRKK
ncbi:DUF3857 domain-containing protein [Dysgonomonas sp. OttesenSCG-928-M03]|nr:DUF3857 domain-containing protein [Dysgonomonas sp. OttesenSCG-928-M03]